MQNNRRKARLFDLRRLPQDMARLVCACLVPLYRMKRLTPEGEKYRGLLRGGAVVAANHRSFQDPFVVGVTFWYRRMFFLVAEIVMVGWLRRLLLKGVGAVEIDRNGADIEAVRKSVDILKRGHLLTVFPQGGISHTEDVAAIKSGAVLMALQAGVPIIPMHIFPAAHWYSRRRVVIGKTIDPKDYVTRKFPTTGDIEKITGVLMAEMNRCAMQQEVAQ